MGSLSELFGKGKAEKRKRFSFQLTDLMCDKVFSMLNIIVRPFDKGQIMLKALINHETMAMSMFLCIKCQFRTNSFNPTYITHNTCPVLSAACPVT